jgi:hypothetical protein
MDWAATQQRAFQSEMAAAVRAIKSGAPGGWAALLLAAGAYGVVHAAGPGHGKYLIADGNPRHYLTHAGLRFGSRAEPLCRLIVERVYRCAPFLLCFCDELFP